MTGARVRPESYQFRGQGGQWVPYVNWQERHVAIVPVLWHLCVGTALALVRVRADTNGAGWVLSAEQEPLPSHRALRGDDAGLGAPAHPSVLRLFWMVQRCLEPSSYRHLARNAPGYRARPMFQSCARYCIGPADEQGEDVEGRFIGPVEVLQHQQHRRC